MNANDAEIIRDCLSEDTYNLLCQVTTFLEKDTETLASSCLLNTINGLQSVLIGMSKEDKEDQLNKGFTVAAIKMLLTSFLDSHKKKQDFEEGLITEEQLNSSNLNFEDDIDKTIAEKEYIIPNVKQQYLS